MPPRGYTTNGDLLCFYGEETGKGKDTLSILLDLSKYAMQITPI